MSDPRAFNDDDFAADSLNKKYFHTGEIEKCATYFKEQFSSEKNHATQLTLLLSLCMDALQGENLFSPQLKASNIRKLMQLLNQIDIRSVVSDATGDVEKALLVFSNSMQLEKLLVFSEFQEQIRLLDDAKQAELFLQAIQLEDVIIQMLPHSSMFFEILNQNVAKVLCLLHPRDSLVLRKHLYELDQLPIGDYLLLYEQQGEQKDKQRILPITEREEHLFKLKSEAKEPAPRKGKVYFYDRLDSDSTAAMEEYFKEASRNGLKCLYVELPIQLSYLFKRANRLCDAKEIQEILLTLKEFLIKKFQANEDRVLSELNHLIKIIEQAYQHQIQVLPVIANSFLPISSIEAFHLQANLADQIYDHIVRFNQRLNGDKEKFVGLFSIHFSELAQLLHVPSHLLLHSESLSQNEFKVSSADKTHLVLAHGIFKSIPPIDELTILDRGTESKSAPLLKDLPLIHDWVDADKYLAPLSLAFKHIGVLKTVDIVNICLIANSLNAEQAQQLVDNFSYKDAKSDESLLRKLLLEACCKEANLPEPFKQQISSSPYYSPLGRILKLHPFFNADEFTQALQNKKGIFFFQCHDDLESYECLIQQLPIMAQNRVRPVRHLYLELPVTWNDILIIINEEIRCSEKNPWIELKNMFDSHKNDFACPRSAELLFQMIQTAQKHNIKIYAVDNPEVRSSAVAIACSGDEAKSEHIEARFSSKFFSALVVDRAFATSDQDMAKQIGQFRNDLKSDESYIGLFGLRHQNLSELVSSSESWAFLPRNYFKSELDWNALMLQTVTTQIDDQASEIVSLLKKHLPQVAKVLITRPADLAMQREELEKLRVEMKKRF